MEPHTDDRDKGGHWTAGRLVFFGYALIAMYFLLTEHRAHLIGALPYLLLAACPLMHLFHHHGGHGHGHVNQDGTEITKPEAESHPER